MKADTPQPWDWTLAALLVAAVFTSASRLVVTAWTPDLGLVSILAFFGAVLGLALGRSRFGPAAVRWLVAGYTLFIVPSQLINMVTGETTLAGQLASLGGRILASLSLLFAGKPIQDHVFFVSQMCLLFWAIGIYSGYRLMRRPGVFAVLLPTILPMLIIQYYDGYKADRIWALAFYFFLALTLTGRINLLRQRERWDREKVLVGSDPEFDLARNMAVAAAIIVLAAWLLPAPAAMLPAAVRAWRSLSEPFDGARQTFNDMLAALHGDTNNSTASELYGSSMGLGRSAGKGDTEIFRVTAPPDTLTRLYWRVRAYDFYADGRWQAAGSQSVPFDPAGGNIPRPDVLPSPGAEFVFNWIDGQSALLITPPQPVWSSRKGFIQAIIEDSGPLDPLSWYATASLQPGDQYRINALLLDPTLRQLRAAPRSYPDWVKTRYLQIPEKIAPDLRQLAQTITAGQTTPYDQAEAITDYLRKNITYAPDVPEPPPGSDSITWFLFGWKSGFCNYYASAEVLLLRSIGIPARLVVGYAQGRELTYGQYSVRGQDAHAWPEAYFPGIGWVEFEPTVIRQPIDRPSGEDPLDSGLLPGGPAGGSVPSGGGHEAVDPTERGPVSPASSAPLPLATVLGGIISVLGFALAALLIWRVERRAAISRRVPALVLSVYTRYNLRPPVWLRSWARWSQAGSVERSFHAVNQSLAWLRKPQPEHATPAERAALLTALVPEAAPHIAALTAALEQTVYSPRAVDPALAARQAWQIRFLTLKKLIRGVTPGE